MKIYVFYNHGGEGAGMEIFDNLPAAEQYIERQLQVYVHESIRDYTVIEGIQRNIKVKEQNISVSIL